MVAAEASKGMGADEESFNVPVPVTQKVRDACVQTGIKMMQVWFNWQQRALFQISPDHNGEYDYFFSTDIPMVRQVQTQKTKIL